MRVTVSGAQNLIFLFGAVLILLSAYTAYGLWQDFHTKTLTHASVKSTSSDTAYFEFTDSLGKKIAFEEFCLKARRHNGSGPCDQFYVGQSVLIAYDPLHPQEAKAMSVLMRGLIIFTTLAFGIFFLIVRGPLGEKLGYNNAATK